MFSAVIVGADKVSAELLALGPTINVATDSLVAHFGLIYQTRVKAAASGRPGPRVITGDYRRSINMELTRLPTGVAAVVGTSDVRARRLEFGYMNMRDSLGRVFHQPPYPHFEPPLAKTAQEFEEALSAAIAKAVT